MGFIEGGIAFFGLLFATVLSFLALWTRASKWWERKESEREQRFKEMVVEAISEHGLIKEGANSDVWPNGSDNMPDFLRVLWESLEATQAGLHALHKRVSDEHEPTVEPKYPRSLDN